MDEGKSAAAEAGDLATEAEGEEGEAATMEEGEAEVFEGALMATEAAEGVHLVPGITVAQTAEAVAEAGGALLGKEEGEGAE